jgi:hypothetical protein
MTTNYPSSKSASGKNASSKVSAKSVIDVESYQLQRYVLDNHAPFYKGKRIAFAISLVLAGNYYNRKKGKAYPSKKTLARQFDLSTRQLSEHIATISQVRDDEGNLLWKVIPGYKIGDKTKNNEYVPLFRRKVFEVEPVPEEPEEPFMHVDEDYSPEEEFATGDAVDAFADEESLADYGDDNDESEAEVEDDGEYSEESFNTESDAEPECKPDSEPDYGFLEEPAVQGNRLTASIVLPNWVPSDVDAMMAAVQKSLNHKKSLENPQFSPYNHKMPPIVSSEAFQRLASSDKQFLSKLLFYVSNNGAPLSQEEYDERSHKLVRRWHQEGLSNSDFYLKFMKGFAPMVPHLDLM